MKPNLVRVYPTIVDNPTSNGKDSKKSKKVVQIERFGACRSVVWHILIFTRARLYSYKPSHFFSFGSHFKTSLVLT